MQQPLQNGAPNDSVPSKFSEPGQNVPIKILLVEDSAINRQLLARQINRLGHDVQLAATGEEALEMFTDTHFDLVLLDVNLDGMSGIETCEHIRQLESASNRPFPAYIAAVTANADPKLQVECLSAGMNDWLGKPIPTSALRELIESVTKLRTGEDSPSTMAGLSAPTSAQVSVDTLDTDRLAILLDLTDKERFLLKQLFDMFRQSVEQNTVRLRSAIYLDDSALAAKAAHAIRSSSVEIGAARIALSAEKAENLARAGELGELPRFVESLPLLLERFAQRFHEEVEEKTDDPE